MGIPNRTLNLIFVSMFDQTSSVTRSVITYINDKEVPRKEASVPLCLCSQSSSSCNGWGMNYKWSTNIFKCPWLAATLTFFLFSIYSPPQSNTFRSPLQWGVTVARDDEWYSENCSLKYFWKGRVFSIVYVKRYRPQIQILSICLKVRQWQWAPKERHL